MVGNDEKRLFVFTCIHLATYEHNCKGWHIAIIYSFGPLMLNLSLAY